MKTALVVSAQSTRDSDVAFVGNLEQSIAQVAQLGYDGVELAVRDPALVDVPALIATLARLGLSAPVIGTGQAWLEERLSFTSVDPLVRKRAIERVIAQIQFAQRLNSMVMLGLIRGQIPAGMTREQAMQLVVEAVQQCAAFARGLGVRIVIEPINRFQADLIHSTQDGLNFLNQVGYDNVGLVLDTFHMNIEDKSIEASIRMARGKIFHFHVSDSNRGYPGAGHIDFAGVIRALREIGYAGFVSGEFTSLPDAETAARRAIEHLRPLIQASAN